MAVKIGGNSYSTPVQGSRLPKFEKNLLVASQVIVNISMGTFPAPVFAGSFWVIPVASPGVKLFVYMFTYHVRVQITATGAELNCTPYSRANLGSVDPINTNNVTNGFFLDGNNPHVVFNKPLPINYDSTSGILFNVRMLPNQIPGYTYTVGDTAEIDASMTFSL